MKKCLLIVAALFLLVAVTFGFADISASVYMVGSLYGTDGFMLNDQNQKDADMLQFAIWGDKTGAIFKLWTDLKGDSSTVHMRSAKLYWKPISTLTLSIGNVGQYGYTEQLDWWKTPTGASLSQASGWYQRWANNDTGEAGGIQVDYEIMKGFSVSAGIYPGFAQSIGFMDEDDDEFYDKNTAWGIHARYNIEGFGSVLGAFKDNGNYDYKIGRIGFDVNAVPNLYAFLTAIFFIDDTNAAQWTDGTEDGDMMARGVAIDNYIKYTLDKLTLEGRFPITLRITGDEGDDSFMTWRVRAMYALEGFSVYLNAETVDYQPINFAAATDTLSVSIRPGLTWSIEKGWFDVGIQLDFPQAVPASHPAIKWSISFQARVSW
jgi:hypothetical protein